MRQHMGTFLLLLYQGTHSKDRLHTVPTFPVEHHLLSPLTMRAALLHVLLSCLLWSVKSDAADATTITIDDAANTGSIAKKDDGSLGATLPLPPALDPKVSYFDLWDHHECEAYFESPHRPTNYDAIWKSAQRAYIDVMMKVNSSIQDEEWSPESSLKVPYSVHYVEGKGLGLFANERIRKGFLVLEYSETRAMFRNGDIFRQFIHKTSQVNEISCLLLQASGVESYCNASNFFISTYLDDGYFINHGDEPNVGELDDDLECPDDWDREYALRDIEAGEEILCSYDAYHGGPGWEAFAL